MEPGIHRDIPIDVYHASPGISKTGLDRINRSPAYFYAMALDPKRPPEKARGGQLEGTLAHCAVLEPDEFDRRYVVGPDVTRSTKVWKEFEASLPNGVVGIKPDQREVAMRQRESVLALPDVREALAVGHAETSAAWIDPDTGVLCRCRPDFTHPVGESGVILIDLKTYSDASPDEFARQAARKRYEVQDAFYSDGYAHASGKDVLAFIFVAVETEYPFTASAVMFDDISKQSGRAKYQSNLQTYAQCQQSGEWPGPGTGIKLITLPTWAL